MAQAESGQQGPGVMPDLNAVFGLLRDLADKASTKTAFGEPVNAAGRAVIPVADVVAVAGFGMGQGLDAANGGGGGAGGGGVARSRALATVVVDDQGVRMVPVIDVSRLGLAAMATVGFTLIWVLRLLTGNGTAAAATAKTLPSPAAMRRLVGKLD